jgi:hypothetical protein
LSSPGPDGLRIRQTRDATVIRVFPNAPMPSGWGLLGSVLLVVGWFALRGALPPGLQGVSVAVLAVLLGGVAAWGVRSVRRGAEVLEVYVGKRVLHLVWSRNGAVVREEEILLLQLEDAQPAAAGVTLLVEARAPLLLPMAKHSDEARGWMVEHLRGAGLGARRRFGHLPPEPRS